MPSERRLHPATLLFSTARHLRELILPLGVALFTAGGSILAWLGAGLAVIVLLAAGWAVLAYLRFTYSFDATRMVVRSGVLFRQERHIPYARVQNIDAVQNLAHRLTGTAVVHVQTGSGTEPEASLKVLGMAAVDEMRARVREAAGDPAGGPVMPAPSPPGQPAPPPPAERLLLHLDAGELLLSGFIENRGMVLIFGALALLERADVFERMAREGSVPGMAALRETMGPWSPGQAPTLGAAALALSLLMVLLLVVRLISVVWALIRLHDYRLTLAGEDLRISYGLLTRVTATVPLRRVQLVAVEEGIVHRLLRRVQVRVVTAGGGTGEGGSSQRELLAPILRAERLDELLAVLMPGTRLAALEWHAVHRKAFGRMLRRGLLPVLVLTVVAALLVRGWAVLVGAGLLARLLIQARMRARRLGWSLGEGVMAARGGGLRRYIRAARVERIQGLSVRHNPFDRRAGMAHLKADTAGSGGGLDVPYMPAAEAAELAERLRREVVATPFTW